MSFQLPSLTITFDAALRDIANGSPKARAHAANALGGARDATERRRAIDALTRALDDDRPEVRAGACASLGELGAAEPNPGLVDHIVKRLSDGTPVVRQNAAIALGTLRAPTGFEPLAEVLRDGPADLRFQAATSLAEIDPARAFDHVLAALADRDAQVVGAAALSVGAIAAELHDPALEARARDALGARLDHADAVARFDVAYALADLDDARGVKTLAAATTDADRAWDAITALGRLRAVPELVAALAHKKTPQEAQTLAAGRLLALGGAPQIGDRPRKVLLDALGARKDYVRGIAIEQLADVGGAWAREPLERLARSSKGIDMQESIASTLRAIAGREQ